MSATIDLCNFLTPDFLNVCTHALSVSVSEFLQRRAHSDGGLGVGLCPEWWKLMRGEVLAEALG